MMGYYHNTLRINSKFNLFFFPELFFFLMWSERNLFFNRSQSAFSGSYVKRHHSLGAFSPTVGAVHAQGSFPSELNAPDPTMTFSASQHVMYEHQPVA